jgi:hypothetical protein
MRFVLIDDIQVQGDNENIFSLETAYFNTVSQQIRKK